MEGNNMLAVIAALIIIVGFGTTLLVYFHYEDKKNAQIHLGEMP
jgi:hypothetical protein